MPRENRQPTASSGGSSACVLPLSLREPFGRAFYANSLANCPAQSNPLPIGARYVHDKAGGACVAVRRSRRHQLGGATGLLQGCLGVGSRRRGGRCPLSAWDRTVSLCSVIAS